jgi:integrase
MDTSVTPWNKDQAIGQKAPLRHYQVWRIRRALEKKGEWRNLALFSTAVDSMLRCLDLLALKVGDLTGKSLKPKVKMVFRQKKTGKGVDVELSPYTRNVLSIWIDRTSKTSEDFLFTRRGDDHGTPISAVQYRKLVKHWVKTIGLPPEGYSTHSLRRTLPSWIYKKTANIEAVRNLLGQSSVTATSRYLNVGGKQSLDIAREFRLSS